MNTKGWSFCIASAPGNDAVLSQCINSIEREFAGRDDYEILVIGATPGAKYSNRSPVRAIAFEEEVFSLSWRNVRIARKSKSWRRLIYRTGAISHKKNLAAREARFDKLCVMHDYVGLNPGWRQGFEVFSPDWEVAMTVILNADGSRHRDWNCWNHPLIATGSGRVEACLMPYDTYTRHMYISGTYFCVKKDFFMDNPLNERLFWGEGEDVEWSHRVRDKTRFQMNTNSIVQYLKLKNLYEAPYCTDWARNKEKLEYLIKDQKVF
nr:hypothetical protein [uncultured Rhodoferax sp.]